MDLKFIVVLSIVIQVMAAFLALKLIRLTGCFTTAWVFIALASCLMAVRRALSSHPLSQWIFGTLGLPDIIDASLVLATSVLMFTVS